MPTYAVIKADGREYKVAEGDLLDLDFRRNAAEGDKISFSDVLMTSSDGKVRVGAPTVKGAGVEAEVVSPLKKGPKLIGMKRVLRNSIRFKQGHRQKYTTVRITSVKA
ncbi:MAG: 50S ribosomal protein L21 [Planctomycetes bacterium]|nr:50S ribosomal protein L21 [Planctomycetota bacterium]